MLSAKIKNHLIKENIFDENEDLNYQKVIRDLGIDEESSFAEFNLYTNAVTFSGRYVIYNICWFAINSHYLENVSYVQSSLKLPTEYIPLDSFEGGGGFFYNRKTGEVLELELGEKLEKFWEGKLIPQWKNFNEFLEWFFELDE